MFFFFQAEDGIRDGHVTGVQTCALPILPTTEGGGFAGLTASATELLNKVNTMPFEQIGKNLDGILKSVNDVAQGPQMKKALNELAGMIASAQNMVQNL